MLSIFLGVLPNFTMSTEGYLRTLPQKMELTNVTKSLKLDLMVVQDMPQFSESHVCD